MVRELLVHRFGVWRGLRVDHYGPPRGFPVFLLHGTPGCRLSHRPDEADLCRLDVHLVTYDRPGYGRSTPHPGRSVADVADDVRAIADHLGIGRFAVVGRSGGGPHALACAALLPGRVVRAASLVGLAPFDAPGLDWFAGMAEMNRRQYAAAVRGSRALREVLVPKVQAMRADPEHLIRDLDEQAADDDQTQLGDPRFRADLIEGIRESVHRSVDGWLADSLAFTRPWGFDPAWIQVPVSLWHGTQDVFSPVSHSRWLSARISNAVLHESQRRSHLAASAAQLGELRWAAGGDVDDRIAG
jgi:pimeloyl-ACP methyl ester carboxylesterase